MAEVPFDFSKVIWKGSLRVSDIPATLVKEGRHSTAQLQQEIW